MTENLPKLPYRIGQGFDIHALCQFRPLIIGGVTIEHDYGLLGHSDADVLLHAITDALLGAVALRDIGYHFSDTDPQFKNANSRELLKKAYEMVKQKGYRLGNLDATIIAEAPKLSPYIDQMIDNISKDLQMDTSCVNVKAKTMEKLGCIGRKEGMMAEASVLLLANAD